MMNGWFGHRKAVPDYFGEEWYATLDWHYERIVLDSTDYHMRVKLEVEIHGKGDGERSYDPEKCPRSRPESFYAQLTSRGAVIAVVRGTCRSIKQALAKVDSISLDEPLRFFLYLLQRRAVAKTIFREDPKTGEYEAFCTEIGSRWCDPSFLPSGNYIKLGWEPGFRDERSKLSLTGIDRNGWGYSTIGIDFDHKRIDPNVIAQLPYATQAEYERVEAEHDALLCKRYEDGYPILGKKRPKKRIS